MSINFPNPSRAFNLKSKSVTFWGSDRALEVVFELDHSALSLMDANAKAEAELLIVFDNNRKLIEAAAARAYKATGSGYYRLSRDSF